MPHAAAQSNWTRELRAMTALAVPVVLSELGWMSQGIVDTIMVGRLGPAAIGAVSVGNAVFYVPSLFGIGLMLGLDTLESAGQRCQAGRDPSQAALHDDQRDGQHTDHHGCQHHCQDDEQVRAHASAP